MRDQSKDEALEHYLKEIGLVSSDQLAAARTVQAKSAREGCVMPLSEALLMNSVITPEQAQFLEKKVQAIQAVRIPDADQQRLSPTSPGPQGSRMLEREAKNLRKMVSRPGPKVSRHGTLLREKARRYWLAFCSALVPRTAKVNLSRVAFCGSLLLVAAAVPLGMQGLAVLLCYLVPCMLPVLILGWIWRSRALGVAAIVLAFISPGVGVGAIVYWHHQDQKQRLSVELEQRLAVEREERARIEAARRAVHGAEAAKAAALAEEAEKVALQERERQAKEEVDRQFMNQLAKKERDEKKAKALAEKRARESEEQEKRRKAEEEAAARLKKEQEEKRVADRRDAQAVLPGKVVHVESCKEAVARAERAIVAANRDIVDNLAILERAKSPEPPSEAELTKAQKQLDQAKKDLDQAKKDLVKSQEELQQAKKEVEDVKATLKALGD